jgi:CofH subfamily radical SAM domain protein
MMDAFLARYWTALDRRVRAALDRALEGGEVTVDDGLALAEATGRELSALTLVADELRARQSGDVVTYVVNRNINFTNVCIKHCTFCAFSRDHREEEGYFLPLEEVLRRAREAQDLGATEVCMQAGLAPKLDGRFYIDMCRSVHDALPDLHIHAFSPEEVLYGVTRSGMPVAEYLGELRDAGLGTLPGTSAEILDDEVRDVISRGRISTSQWLEIITTAHRLGIQTTSTMM